MPVPLNPLSNNHVFPHTPSSCPPLRSECAPYVSPIVLSPSSVSHTSSFYRVLLTTFCRFSPAALLHRCFTHTHPSTLPRQPSFCVSPTTLLSFFSLRTFTLCHPPTLPLCPTGPSYHSSLSVLLRRPQDSEHYTIGKDMLGTCRLTIRGAAKKDAGPWSCRLFRQKDRTDCTVSLTGESNDGRSRGPGKEGTGTHFASLSIYVVCSIEEQQ